MPDSRIINLPDAAPLVDADAFVVDAAATGDRKVTLAALKSAIGSTRPFQVSAAGLILTVTAGTRLLRDGTPLSFAGGTISAAATNGTYYLSHTAANALAINSTFPVALDSLLLARVVVSAGGTLATPTPQSALGGDLLAANNLKDVTDLVAARANLGVSFAYQPQSSLSAAGNTDLTIPDSNTDGVFVFNVNAGAAPYTRTVSLYIANGAGGTKATLLFNLPAAPVNSPTIEVRSGLGGAGPLLCALLAGPFARTERVEVVYNPTTWVLVSCGPEPHIGAQQFNEAVLNQVPVGGLKFDGSVGKFAEAVVRGIALGTGDYTATVVFRCSPVSSSSGGSLLSFGGLVGGTSGVTGEFVSYFSAGGSLLNIGHRSDPATLVSSAINLSAYNGRTIQLGIVRRAGVISVWVDGQAMTFVPPSTQAVAQAGPDTVVRLGSHLTTAGSYGDRIIAAQLFSRALSSAELRMLAVRGVASEDRNAAGVVISPTLLNGGFETSGAGGLDVFALWTEAVNGASVITKDTGPAPVPEGTYTCRMQMDASKNQAYIFQDGPVVTGRNYLASWSFRHNCAGNVGCGYFLGDVTASTRITAPVPPNQWNQMAIEGVSSSGAPRFGFITALLGSDASSSHWVDNVLVTSVGCLVDLDCTVGCGYSFPDVQGRFPANVVAGGYANFVHVRPARRGQLLIYVNSPSSVQVVGLPLNARISNMVADSGGGVSVSVGVASSGSSIVASQALGTGKVDLTLASRYTNTGNLYVTPTVATPIVLTVNFEMIS